MDPQSLRSTSDLAFHFQMPRKYRVENPDGSLGGISIAKLYADGIFGQRASDVRLSIVGAPVEPAKSYPPRLDRQKLEGVLTLADLNQRRAVVGKTTALSNADFEMLKARTATDFSAYMSDPEMAYRRNRYIMDMAEIIPPGMKK